MSNVNFIQYNSTTGRVLHSGTCPSSTLHLQDVEGLVTLEGIGSIKADYVDAGVVKAKTSFNLTLNKTTVTADGVDTITSSNVPLGTILRFDGETYEIDDGELEITLDVVGVYQLRLDYPQNIKEVIEIEGI